MGTISTAEHMKDSGATHPGAGVGYPEGRAPRRRPSATLSVIVPVYNEQFLVEASLARLRVLSDTALLESVKVIVVDDGSSDATPDALDRFRAWLDSQDPDPKISWVWVRHKKNAGKGAAIRTGLTYVDTEPCGDSRRGPRVSPARPAENGGGVSRRGCGRGFRLAVHGGRVQARAFLPAFAGEQIPDVFVRSRLRPESDGHGDVLQDGPGGSAEEHSARERDV